VKYYDIHRIQQGYFFVPKVNTHFALTLDLVDEIFVRSQIAKDIFGSISRLQI
jgi:hypothetical protein